MKVLLVTDQLLKIEGNNILGPTNFTSVVKRLSILGELHLCVRRCRDDSKSIQIYNDILNEYVKAEHITFIDKSFIWPSNKTISQLKHSISSVDLVIGYVPALNAEVAHILTKKMGKKFFALMVACPWDGLWNQDWKRKIAAPYRYLMNKWVVKHSDYVLYVTNKFLQNRYPTIGNSVGISNVVLTENHIGTLQKRIIHIDQKQEKEPIRIATTAMLDIPYKGQRFVIKAIAKLKEMGYPQYHYYLIGGGDCNKLSRIAKKYGVEEQVHFVGKLTHDDVFSTLDKMDIYVHPSLQEGLPRSVVEAMSRALPCIGFHTAAIPELLDKRFVVKRKSVDQIVNRLLLLQDKEVLKEQAARNFNESKKYECNVLDNRRREFYEMIRNDIEG